MLEFVLARYNYWIVIVLMMTGLYIVFSRGNLVKTVVGLNIFQTSVFIFYITIGKIAGGTAPILVEGHGDEGHEADHGDGHGDALHGAADHGEGHASEPHASDLGAVEIIETTRMLGTEAADAVLYSNPLPHVLILTAIVVGVATTAVGLAIAVRIREAYGTVEEDLLEAMDNQAADGGQAADPGLSATGEGAA